MKNKGLTIVELLAVFIVLGIIATIAIPAANKIKRESAENTFRESAKGVITAAQSYYAENNYEEFPEDGMIISDKRLRIKNQSVYQNGTIYYNSALGQFEIQLLTDGDFCANGTLDDLTISEGNCQSSDKCFIFDETTSTITGYKFDDTQCFDNIVIPDKINNKPVLKVGDYAFTIKEQALRCSTDDFLTTTLHDIDYIKQSNEKCIFEKINLEERFESPVRSISFPSSIEEIGENAFAGSKIKILNLVKNKNLKEIKTGAFMGSKSLNTVDFYKESIINKIDAYAFAFTEVKDINFQTLKEISYIGNSAFYKSTPNSVNLSDSSKLYYIGANAFASLNSKNIELNIGNKTQMTELGKGAFCNSNFVYQGWTNISDYIPASSINDACLNSYIG